jgi:hypothetical protein
MRRKTLYIKPNEASKRAAQKGLDARKKASPSNRGGLDAMQAKREGVGSGVLRARDIIAGKRINAYQVKAFFDRHKSNYVNAVLSGKKPHESRAIQAWLIWGGEPLRKQVEKAVAKDKAKSDKPKSNPGKPSDIESMDIAWPRPELSFTSVPSKKNARRLTNLGDARSMAIKHESFSAPNQSQVRRLKVGDAVQVERNGERFWVGLSGYIGKEHHGKVLHSKLARNSDLSAGDVIAFHTRHVYDIRRK